MERGMFARFPLYHGGNVSWDELAVFVGFALIVGLVTHWIDYRRGTSDHSAGDDPEHDQRKEDGGGAQTHERREPGVDEIGDGVRTGRGFTLERLTEP
jgi:hypothetical protein